MTTPSPALASLVDALQVGRREPVPAAGWERFARRRLAPDETVLLALEGNGFTWWDPLLLVTDRRVIHLREWTFIGWRTVREVPARAVAGGEFRPHVLGWGPVIVRLRDGGRIRVRSKQDDAAQRFVDGLNRLIAGGR